MVELARGLGVAMRAKGALSLLEQLLTGGAVPAVSSFMVRIPGIY
jgi:hypothetical protein